MKKGNDIWVEVFKEKFKGLKKALNLQAKEYERRLEALNGEAGRLREMQQKYIPREVFDRMVNSLNDKREAAIKELENKIEILTNYKTKEEGKSQWAHYVPWLLTIIAIIASWYKGRL